MSTEAERRPPWATPSSPVLMGFLGLEDASAVGTPALQAAEKICPRCRVVFGPELRFCPADGSGLLSPSSSRDLVGSVIAERYHILGKLGEGGMGTVYLAEHVPMGRRCAVKVINPILAHDPDSVSRFKREAANASRINHPNVAAIYDFGETRDDIVYLAMELIEGEALSVILHREGALNPSRAIELARQMAEALAAAHELSIVHRDLKPDNIMVTQARGGEIVKVVDFGIAKVTQGARQTVTRTGFVVGTPAYMSPEQFLGEELDGGSDVYGLGCILYEMLTGQRAFTGSSGEVSLGRRLSEPPPHPRQIKRHLAKSLDRLVTKALARAPQERFQSALAMRDALLSARADIEVRTSWRDCLPWGRPRRSSIKTGRQPGIEVEAGTSSALQPVSPGSSTPSPQSGPGPRLDTVPVPLGWEEAVQRPVLHPTRSATLIPCRPERHARDKARGIIVGCFVAVLVGLIVWRFIAPVRPVENPMARLHVEPGPVSVPRPADRDTRTGDTAQAPPSSREQPPSPSKGSVRFARPLPSGAHITVDGQEATVAAGKVLSLAPGTHMLVFEAPGFRADSEATNVTAGETSTLLLQLEPVLATPDLTPGNPSPKASRGKIVLIGNIPWGAEISLDGRRLPPNERVLTATPGLHWLRLSVPGYQADSGSVEVRAGARTSWIAPDLRLSPTEPAPESNPPRVSAPARRQDPSRTEQPANVEPQVPAALPAGTSFSATTDAEIRSHKNKVGDEVTATVGADVNDASGRVVIPMGSQVTLRVTAIKVSKNESDTTGTLSLKPTALSINGSSQQVKASISGLKTRLEDRKTNAGDIARVGVGMAVGAVVGRIFGGSKTGAVVGGVLGGAVSAERAVETKDRDIVAAEGTVVTLTLGEELVAQAEPRSREP
jgi:serine/threonine protein kinase